MLQEFKAEISGKARRWQGAPNNTFTIPQKSSGPVESLSCWASGKVNAKTVGRGGPENFETRRKITVKPAYLSENRSNSPGGDSHQKSMLEIGCPWISQHSRHRLNRHRIQRMVSLAFGVPNHMNTSITVGQRSRYSL